MNDCTYSRYADRRTRDYIARLRAARLGSLARGNCRESSTHARRARRPLWRRSLGGLLPARSRPQPLRRQGTPGRGAPRLRQPDARVAADWRGVVATSPPSRRATGAGGSLLSDGTIRVDCLDLLSRDHMLRIDAAHSARDMFNPRCDYLRCIARVQSEPSLLAHDTDDRAAAPGDDVSGGAVAGGVG